MLSSMASRIRQSEWKKDIRQLIHHHQEQLTKGPLVCGTSLLQDEEYVAHKHHGGVGRQSIVRQAVTLGKPLQIGLAGLKEDLNIPPFAVNPDDFSLRQGQWVSCYFSFVIPYPVALFCALGCGKFE